MQILHFYFVGQIISLRINSHKPYASCTLYLVHLCFEDNVLYGYTILHGCEPTFCIRLKYSCLLSDNALHEMPCRMHSCPYLLYHCKNVTLSYGSICLGRFCVNACMDLIMQLRMGILDILSRIS